MSRKITFRQSLIATVVASALGAVMMPGNALASEADVLKKIEALQAAIDAQNAEIAALKAQVKAKPAAAPVAATTDGKVAKKSDWEWYGLIDMGVESNDDGTARRTIMQSFSSRIGWRGHREFANGLTGVMQVETKIAPDDVANSKLFASRNSYIGLQGGWGTVAGGTYDTPFKLLKANVALLEGNADTMEHIIHGKANAAIGANFHTRPTNSFMYWSPKFSDIQVRLAYSPDENKDTYTGATLGSKRIFLSSAIEYNNGTWNLGAATDKKGDPITLGKDITAVKFIAGMKLANMTFGGAYSKVDNDAGKKANNWMIAAKYDMNPFILKANYGVAGEASSNAKDGGKIIGLEADYVLDKQTFVYLYYANYSGDSLAKGFKFDAGENGYKTLKAGDDASVIGLAIQYKF
ncbi:MAG: porin [Betaproteobacteria bacterium]|nr:porin [Betaproteobacteria bacterium]